MPLVPCQLFLHNTPTLQLLSISFECRAAYGEEISTKQSNIGLDFGASASIGNSVKGHKCSIMYSVSVNCLPEEVVHFSAHQTSVQPQLWRTIKHVHCAKLYGCANIDEF